MAGIPTMRDVYKGSYKGTFEEIPTLSVKHTDTIAELSALDTAENNDIDVRLVALAQLMTAMFQKTMADDGIEDDFNRTRAMEAMDCFVGKLGTI